MVRNRAKVGDVVWVTTDPHGDRYVHGVSSPHGGRNEGGTGGGAEEEAEEEEAKAPEVAQEALETAQEALEAAGGSGVLAEAGIGMILHGSDAGKARGSDFAHYVWVGSVIPSNAIDTDFLVKTA